MEVCNSSMNFKLLNKDTVVCTFFITTLEYGMSCNVLKIFRKDLMPHDLRNIQEWIESRYILSYKEGTKSFFNRIGITRLEDFVLVTNCVSLKDTYWVKGERSKKFWRSVSPYTNSLNKVIADYSFNGKINGKCVTGSPDFATDGNFSKCWKRVNGVLQLYKAGSSGAYNAGNEPYSEVYASKIADLMGISHIEYSLGTYKSRVISKCNCMCSEDIGFISYRDYTGEMHADFSNLLKKFKYNYKILDMLLLDYLLCNVDRHYGNFGFLINNDTNKIVGLSPIFDNNLSCIPYYMSDENIEHYIDDIRAKDGRTWSELFRLIDSKYVRTRISILVGNYRKIRVTKDRDNIVDRMVRLQLKRIGVNVTVERITEKSDSEICVQGSIAKI